MKKLVLALAAVAMIATPVLADVTPYGSARVALAYASADADFTGTTATTALDVVLQGNSRFGIKASTGDVTGRVEFGTGVNTRLLYGTVKLGAGTFLVGQTYTPNTKFSNQALNQDLGFIGFGALYDGRQPMLKYTADMGLYGALIKNNMLAADGDLIPKLVVGFAGSAGSVNYNAGIGYQKYEEVGGADVTSYLLYVCGDAKFGEFGLIYGLHFGKNLGDYGISGRSNSDSWTAAGDSDGYGAMLEADVAGFAFGIGYTADNSGVAASETDAQMALFVNYTVQVAKGFKIVPEITYIDLMDDVAGATEGTLVLAGAKFQMDF